MPCQLQHRTIRRAMAANATSTGFTAKAPTATKPSGNAVLTVVESEAAGGTPGNYKHPSLIQLWPFGLGSNNDGFSMRLWGWNSFGDTSKTVPVVWVPTLLVEVAVVVGNIAGVANSPLLSTELMADTITIVSQPRLTDTDSGGAASRGTVRIYSPANDLVAFLVVPLYNTALIEFDWDQTTNTPEMNTLYALLSE
jgi:hypothetical protein